LIPYEDAEEEKAAGTDRCKGFTDENRFCFRV
jgi:hypothetical protein